jgi:hypothetical protein
MSPSEFHKLIDNVENEAQIWIDQMNTSSKRVNMGSANGAWMGDKAAYTSLHQYVRLYKTKPDVCERCKTVPPFDIYNTSYRQTRNLEDWVYLCRKCIMTVDGRITMSHKHTETAKEKIRQSKLGKKRSDETKEKLRQAHLGKKLTEAHKKKISQGGLGKKRSLETRENIRQALLGKKHSKERVEKVRRALLGRKQSKEAIESNRQAQLRRWKKFRERQALLEKKLTTK